MPVLPLRIIIYGDIKVAAPLSVIIYEEETMSAFFTAGLHFPHFGCIFASAKGAYTCSLFLVSTSKRGLFYLALECHLAQTTL